MKYFYSLAIIMFAVICSYGQTREVSGKVTSSQTKEPLVAASVAAMMKGDNGSYVPTMYGAFTELDGSFVMDIPSDAAALEFSYVGMATKIVPITSETVYNVALAPDALMIETVVVTVPYGKQKKELFLYLVMSPP